ncbi:TonB-dependent receptor [Sphingomonas asaccharolytica]|uniref:TonB-dependent receptor n=1 Tax=Sphingomonas asaccharolytica TaxID=40681 RepID=UPI000834548F|nr:TonB-dependent receptor [Sphingomonas asaccharolytica]
MQKGSRFETLLRGGASLAVLAIAVSAGAAQAQTAPAGPNDAASAAPVTEAPQTAPAADTSQDNQDTGKDIVITGFRGSLAKALDQKKASATAIDSILAEDIGKFPDLNLSESIQRIPGVALSRDGGEGRSISVRGLGPQFTRVRINGMEAIATAGGSDASGGTNRGRGFDFNVFAADLFNAITVQKTAEAATEEGSLGATVDLRTARPFDYKSGFTIAVSGQGSYNDLAQKASPRAAAMISWSNEDKTFGALISAAYTKRKLVESGYSTVRWTTNAAGAAPGFQSYLGTTCAYPTSTGPSTTPECVTANNLFHPRFPRYDYYVDDQQRIGLTGSIQWKPTDSTTISIDGLYADFKATREERYLEANGFSVAGACTAGNRATTCGVNDIDVTAATVQNGSLVAGTFNDVDLRVENRFDRLDTKFKQLTFNVDQNIGDKLKLNLILGHSQSDHQNPIQNTVTFDQYNVDNFAYDYTDRQHPTFNWGTANLANGTGWVLSQLRLRAASAKNTYETGQLNFTWDVTDGFSVEGGASYKGYGFKSTDLRRSNGTTASQDTNLSCCTLPADRDLNQFGQMVTIEGQTFFDADYHKAAAYFGLEDPTARGGTFRLGIEPGLSGNVAVDEHDKSGYLQFNFNRNFGPFTLRGNAGVRYVQTFQRSQGYSYSGGVAVPLVATRTYDDWLPSMNAVFEFSPKFQIRLAAARMMARPDLTSLAPSATVSVSGANRSVSVGNPGLDPFRATTLDAAAEWYYMPGALLSVAFFQKDIDSFVQTVQSSGAYSNNPFGLPDSLAIAACANLDPGICSPSLTNWTFSAPRNSPGGRLRGVEVNFQQPFKFLPGFLGNFGVLLNYTHVESNIKYLNSAGAVVKIDDLTGLSRNSANATLYYEDKVVSARVSAAYRSGYLSDAVGTQGIDSQGYNKTLNIDTSVQITLTKQLKLTFEGINLTDQYQDQYNDSRNLLSVYHHTGREFLAGFRFNY